MKISQFITIFLLFFMLSCHKDEPVISVVSQLTRVEYNIRDPFENPRIEFTFHNTYNLSEYTHFSICILTTSESVRLNLLIMLQDADGHKTDVLPMEISEEDLISDQKPVLYSFDLLEHTASGTSSNKEIQLDRIEKILIYINAGIGGKLSEGVFWLDKLEFSKP